MKTKFTFPFLVTICFVTLPFIVSSQRFVDLKDRIITPMTFPKQNLNPDPIINNEQALYFDAITGQEVVDTTWERHTNPLLIPGDPGALGLGEPLELNAGRTFSSLSQVGNPASYPARTNVLIHMHFPDWQDNYYSQCSGVLIDPKHVLTAGHCVHDNADGGWADNIDVFPAYDEGINEFYGTAQMVNLLSWSGWTQNELWEHDMAIIELDRPVGAITGWVGYGTSYHNAGDPYHNYSYPGEPPYDGELMYVRNGTFESAGVWIKYHGDYSWGGQSGSGSIDPDNYTYSCLSHGTDEPNAYTGHTRMAGAKPSEITAFINENTPDEVDLVTLRANAAPTFLEAGQQLNYLEFNLHNYSSAAFSGTVQVTYYLSEDDYFTGSDVFLGSTSFPGISIPSKNREWLVNNIPLYIPSDIPPGDYYLGLHVTNSDYYSLNNYTDYQDAQPVTIYCSQPEPPSLSHVGLIELCNWDVIELQAYTSCNDCEILWSNGDTGPVIYVSEPGVYYAEATNSCGNSSFSIDVVIVETVYPPDPPEIEIIGSALPCDGDEILLSVNDICNGCDVNWSTGEWGESIYVYEEGTYVAYMSNFCGESQGSFAIIDYQEDPAPATIVANGPTSLCAGQSVTLTAQNVCSGCEVEWSNGQTGASITISTPGTFTARTSNDCGFSPLSNAITTTTGLAPSAPMLSAGGNTILCSGQSITLTASNVCIGCTVNWSNGSTGLSIVTTTAGTFTATVTNPCGVSPASNAITLTSGSIPDTPTISANGSTVICGSGSVTLTASNICSGCTTIWSNGETENAITVLTAGQYSVIVSNDCGQSTPSNVISVTVNASFVPTIEVNDTCKLAAPSGLEYQWSVDDVIIPNSNSRFWTAEVTGYYIVNMINDFGCPGESDAVYARKCFATSISQLDKARLLVYPNPARDLIHFELETTSPLHNPRLSLYASDGTHIETLWQSSAAFGHTAQDISLHDIPSGIYFYHLSSNEGVIQGKLVVVQ